MFSQTSSSIRSTPTISQSGAPAGLPPEVEFIHADIRDADRLRDALRGVDKVVHLAAEVGVGQSMYAVERYVSVNDGGTAVLMQMPDRAAGGTAGHRPPP